MTNVKTPGLFDYIGSLSSKERIDVIDRKNYNVFMVNKAFSFHPDTVLIANEINKYQGIDAQQHYDFYFYALSKRKRFGWHKAEKDQYLDLICEYYQVGYSKAKEIASLLSDEDLESLQKKMYKGGQVNE